MAEQREPGNMQKPFGGGPGRGRGPGGGPPGVHPMMAIDKPKNFKAAMLKFISYLRPYWILLVIVVAFAILSTLFAIVSPKILGNMTNEVVDDYISMKTYDAVIGKLPKSVTIPKGTTGADLLKTAPPALVKKIPTDQLAKIKKLDLSTRPSINFGHIAGIAWMLVGLYLLSALFSYIQGWIMTSITQRIAYKFREDISGKINRMPLKYFDSRSFGDVLSRVTNDVDLISQTLNQGMTQIITSIAMIVGIVIMMLTISWQMTLVALLIIPLSFVFIGIMIKISQKHFVAQQQVLGKINGHVEETYSGHNVVKIFNREQKSIETFRGINEKLYESAWKSQFYSGLMMPIVNVFGNLGFVGVSVLGGWLAVKGTVNIGDIQAFIQYTRQFNQPVMQSANIANVLQSTAAAAERIFEFLGEEEEIPEAANPATIKNVDCCIDFENVVFGYKPGQTIIKGFNASIKPGQRIAIVGPTGAGKTTMVNLLMRFYDVNEGAIKIDNIDIRDMRRSDLRRMFGMVLQDTWLFNGTIRDNIAYGNLNADMEAIVEVAKAAHVDHFVHSLPLGYDMVLNEEADNISQGEKQLMTIARAMLANPPMLILDEATSSVDTRTEMLIQKAMEKLMQGRTSFVIAHRLSTIRDADLILVMNEGNIVEQGKHQDLLDKNGYYASLYNSQFNEPMVDLELTPD